jgi:hypothetical protein
MVDPNLSLEVHEIYSKFEIVVMWDNNFVHLCKVSKILNNKHCGLTMSKMLYQRILDMRVAYGIFMKTIAKS